MSLCRSADGRAPMQYCGGACCTAGGCPTLSPCTTSLAVPMCVRRWVRERIGAISDGSVKRTEGRSVALCES